MGLLVNRPSRDARGSEVGGHQVIVITGTTRGLGRSLCEHYLAKGCTVIGCARQKSTLAHDNYRHHVLSVTDEQAVVSMVRSTSRDHGRIDVLINNAGIASMNLFMLTPLAKMREVHDTNVLGTFLVSREVAKVMSRASYGRIVNIGTIAVPLKLKGELAYASSKSAVVMMTRIMAEELAPHNITCNAVGPGPIRTDLLRGVPEETVAELIGRQAIRRYCECSDVCNVVDFFIKPESSFVTGQVIYLGGVS